MTHELAHAARPAIAAVPSTAPCAEPGSRAADPANPDEAQKRAIARAVWTDLLWLMPRDRTVTVTLRDGAVAVELEPSEPAPATPADA